MKGAFIFPIFRIRDVDVVLDEDIARYLGVETREINQYLKRSRHFRQPYDAFKITPAEAYSFVHFVEGNRNPKRNKRHPYTVYSRRMADRIIWHFKRKSLV